MQAPLGAYDWAGLFAAVSSARTLLLHHRDVLEREDGGPGLIARLVSLVTDAVSNRRSVVQTNGLRCLGELFRCVLVVVVLACDVEDVGLYVRRSFLSYLMLGQRPCTRNIWCLSAALIVGVNVPASAATAVPAAVAVTIPVSIGDETLFPAAWWERD